MPSESSAPSREKDDAETSISKASTLADSARSAQDLEKLVTERVKKLLSQQPQNIDALSGAVTDGTIGK